MAASIRTAGAPLRASLAVLLVAVAASVAPAYAQCADGWTFSEVSGSRQCYRYESTTGSWYSANTWCQNKGAHLVSIHNSAENDLVYGLCQSRRCHIGYNDEAREGDFVWTDGSADDYTAWNSGEPNNCCGSEDCAEVWHASGHLARWNDMPCNGRFGNFESVCKTVAGCPEGKYGSGTGDCRNCPAGRYSDTQSATTVDDCVLCPAGRYGSSAGLQKSTCTGACAKGHYCLDGSTSSTQADCPSGTYGNTASLTSSACNGPCNPGYYCEASSQDPNQKKCAAGRYGSYYQTNSQCSGPCSAGYYCPEASGSSTQNECGSVNRYCPEGASTYTTVSAGYYSTGGDSKTTRTGQTKCEQGFYCTGGERFKCPVGRFGGTEGLTSSSCSGPCAAGYFCPEGSYSASHETCGNGIANEATKFCPQGASARSTVQNNYYTTPESNPDSQRSGEQQCTSDYVCQNGKRAKKLEFTGTCGSLTDTVYVDENKASYTFAQVPAKSNKVPADTVTLSFTYTSIPNGCPSTNPFTLAANGDLKVGSGAINYEECASFELRVTATDSDSNINCVLTVSVVDKNDPPDVDANTALSVQERSPINTVVGTVVATDPDALQELTFSITSGNDDGFFKIGSCSGIVMVIKEGLDHAVKSTYTLGIKVEDDGIGNLFDTGTATITVTNINDPPFFKTQGALTVPENIPGNTATDLSSPDKGASADDPDLPDDKLTWSISRNDAGKWKINADTGIISAIANPGLDYEVRTDYVIEVTVTDEAGLFAVKQFPITVTNMNDPPVMAAQQLTVPENSPATTTLVGPALSTLATDEDVGSVLSFAITGGNDDGFFELASSASGQLRVAKAGLNYEASVNVYNLKISITDNGITGQAAKTTVVDVKVSVTDVNEAPTVNDVSFDFNEEQAGGTLVGTVTGTDPDVGQGHFLTITGGDGEPFFASDASTGKIRSTAKLNYEDPSGQIVFKLNVKYEDTGGLSDTAVVTINLKNINEAPVVTASQSFTIPEMASVGTALTPAKAVATDVDAGDTAALTYTLTAASASGANQGNNTFTVDADGTLRVAAITDFETRGSYSVDVVATDPGTLTGQAGVTITIVNVNENPTFAAASLNVGEKSASGTVIGTIFGADVDTSTKDAENLKYRFTAGAGSLFAVGLTTGKVTAASTIPDFDAVTDSNNVHTITVEVEDPGGLKGTGTLTITVTNANFPPTMAATKTLNLNEDTAESSVVLASLGCTDGDAGDTLKYFIQQVTPGGLEGFWLVNVNTGAVSLGSHNMDFESVTTYTLQIVCQDQGGLQADTTLTINVQNVDEVPKVTTHTFSVPENKASGFVVGTIGVSDEDAGDVVTLALFDHDGTPTGSLPFTLNANTYVLTVTGATDFETRPLYRLYAVGTDSKGLTGSGNITVQLTNVNEAPVAVDNAFALDESTAANPQVGVIVGTVAASDVDNALSDLVFSIPSGNTNNAFSIGNGGLLSVAKSLDWENVNSYSLVVRVKDPGGLQDDAAVSITINNVYDVTFAGFSGTAATAGGNTVGGDKVSVRGTNFGQTTFAGGANATIKGAYKSQTDPNAKWYNATGCTVSTRNTIITCDTVAGVGANLKWAFTITDTHAGGAAVVSSFDTGAVTTSYKPPVITGITGATALSTAGGSVFTITGTQFGPAGTKVSVQYGPSSARTRYAADCSVAVAHTQLSCKAAVGVGTNLGFTVTVGAQTSNIYAGDPLAVPAVPLGYGRPTISSITFAPGKMDTNGGQTVLIEGTNLGADRTTEEAVTARYGPSASEFAAQGTCTKVTGKEHTQVTCTTVPGVGTGNAWVVQVAGQVSDTSTQKLDYQPPVVTDITGAGASEANTVGGQVVNLKGSQFGPAGMAKVVVKYGKNVSSVDAYTAVDCEVRSQTQISCEMAPGTGTGLLWQAHVGYSINALQASNVPAKATTYHAPIVFEFPSSYAGAVDAFTQGGQQVLIKGNHFGARSGRKLEHVSYGPKGTEFVAKNCSVYKDHAEILCLTAPGAGVQLNWVVIVDGQVSVAPTTEYGPPDISSIVLGKPVPCKPIGFNDTAAAPGDPKLLLPRCNDTSNLRVSTDGNDTITITGINFGGEQKYLEYVKYGPNGDDYTARAVTVDSHTQITAQTVPGTGRACKWKVKVQGQESKEVSGPSYNDPNITLIEPNHFSTVGQRLVKITGTDFGLLDTGTTAKIIFNGGTFLDASQPSVISRGRHAYYFVLPVSSGHDLDVVLRLEANGKIVDSPPVKFSYDPPKLTSYAAEPTGRARADGQVEYEVLVIGESLCASTACGTLTFDGEELAPISGDTANKVGILEWNHDGVKIQVTKSDVDITVTVAGSPAPRTSNVLRYELQLARLSELSASTINAARYNTAGGEILFFQGTDMSLTEMSVTVGGVDADGPRYCAFEAGYPKTVPGTSPQEYELKCRTPPGEGATNPVSVAIGDSKTTKDEKGVTINMHYAKPDPRYAILAKDTYDKRAGDKVSTGGVPNAGGVPSDIEINMPTTGGTILLIGSNFGRPTDLRPTQSFPNGRQGERIVFTYGSTNIQVVQPRNHTTMGLLIPPGDGRRQAGVSAGNLQYTIDLDVSGQVPVQKIYVNYDVPAIRSVWPLTGGTAGGTDLYLQGRNFGVTKPVVYVGPRTCTVAFWNHTDIRCKVPANQGDTHEVRVEVSGQKSVVARDTGDTSKFVFKYAAPSISCINPASADTAGGTTVTITGKNLGSFANANGGHYGLQIRMTPSKSVDSYPVAIDVADTYVDVDDKGAVKPVISAYTDTSIRFRLPESQGWAKLVSVVVSGRTSTPFQPTAPVCNPSVTNCSKVPAFDAARDCGYMTSGGQSGVFFSYDPPVVTGLEPGNGPTKGGTEMLVHGSSFGFRDATVSIGGRDCKVLSQKHDLITCVTPQGFGADLATIVTLMQVQSTRYNFSYDKPIVRAITPNPADPRGFTLSIRGQNFGFEDPATRTYDNIVSVQIAGEECTSATWLNDAQLSCQLQPTVAGPKNVTVLVAGQIFFVAADTGFLEAKCYPGYYGYDGEVCLPCPLGATCEGFPGLPAVPDPYSEPGWWRSLLPTPNDICPAERQGRKECEHFIPCEPKEACTGKNKCAVGYTSTRCSECVQGTHYRLAGLCQECPDNPWLILVGFVTAACVAGIVGYILNTRKVNLAFLSIGIDYFQVLAMLANSRVAWPPELVAIYRALGVFNINLEIAAPECAIPEISYVNKWFFIEALPLAAGALFILVHIAVYFWKRCVHGQKKRANRHVSVLIGTALVLFYYLYLYLTRTTLDVFNCSPTDPDDGHEYLEVVFEECGIEGGIQMTLLPWAVLTLVAYTFAYPTFVFFLLWRNKKKVKLDQYLRVQGLGDDKVENPEAFEFRQRFSKLYYHFTPHKWYWILCVIARKAMIAFTSLMFRKTPSFQMAMALLVMFVAYAAQVRHRPYMSMDQREEVLAHLQARVGEESALHSSIQATINAVADDKRRARRKVVKLGEARKPLDAAVAAVWNYNTVESTLLFCSVVVCLSGVMFESNRFESEYFETQKNIITYCVLVIVIASFIYFAMVFCSEVFAVCTPNLFSGKKDKKPLLKGGRGTFAASNPAHGKRGTTAIEMGPAGGRRGSSLFLHNPMMMAAMAPAADAPSGDGLSKDQVNAILDSGTPPQKPTWDTLRREYTNVLDQLHMLQDEVRAMKQERQRAAGSSRNIGGRPVGRPGAGGPRRAKKEFASAPTRQGSARGAAAKAAPDA